MANEWTLNYLPSDGGRLTGRLSVGSEDVRFSALYDSSNSEIIKGIAGALGLFAASGGHASTFTIRTLSSKWSFRKPRSRPPCRPRRA